MASLVLVVAVALIAFLWVRGARRNRLAWLKKLNLPGRWHCATGELVLRGNWNGGRYRLKDSGRDEAGEWRLEGSDLLLIADGEADSTRHDLRLFVPGKIGINGPRLSHRIYERVADNVVQLGVRG